MRRLLTQISAERTFIAIALRNLREDVAAEIAEC
jgi:hypothetical protein